MKRRVEVEEEESSVEEQKKNKPGHRFAYTSPTTRGFLSLSLSLFPTAIEEIKNNVSPFSLSTPSTLSPQQLSLSLSLLQLLQKVRLVHEHHLPPVRVRRRANLGPDPGHGPGVAGDGAPCGFDLLGSLVDVLCRNRDLGVARPFEVFVLGLAPDRLDVLFFEG